MPPTRELVLRVVAAFVLGALAGIERQWHHKNAGVRTHTLVAVGAATFTLVSVALAAPSNSMVIAAGVVTGIGFIGYLIAWIVMPEEPYLLQAQVPATGHQVTNP